MPAVKAIEREPLPEVATREVGAAGASALVVTGALMYEVKLKALRYLQSGPLVVQKVQSELVPR